MTENWNQPYVSREQKDNAKCKICSDVGCRMPGDGPLDMRIEYCNCKIGRKMKKTGFEGHSYYLDHNCDCKKCREDKENGLWGDNYLERVAESRKFRCGVE